MRKKTVYLTPEQNAGIRARLALIEQVNLHLNTLRDGLQQFIERECGVDLDKQDWALDLDHNFLERQTRK